MDSNKIIPQYKELSFCAGNLTSSAHKLILLIHASNLSSGWKCTGLLEDEPEAEFVLPPKWNEQIEGIYSLRYTNPKNKETIFFKFIEEGQILDVNAVRSTKTGRIYSSAFDLSKLKDIEGSADSILKQYQKDVADPINDQENKTIEEQSKSRDRMFIEPQQPENPFWRLPRNNEPTGTNPFGGYGRSDLMPIPDPYSQPLGGSGNLLGPGNPIFTGGPNAGGMGLGRPGARFDPFAPDDIDPFGNEPNRGPPGGKFGGAPGFGGFGGNGGFGGGSGGGFWGKPM